MPADSFDFDTAEKALLDLLAAKPLTLAEIMAGLSAFSETEVRSAIRRLRASGFVSQTNSYAFALAKPLSI